MRKISKLLTMAVAAAIILPMSILFAGCDLFGGNGNTTVNTLDAGVYTGTAIGQLTNTGEANDSIGVAATALGGSPTLGFSIDGDGLVTFTGSVAGAFALGSTTDKNFQFVLGGGNSLTLQKKVFGGQNNAFTWTNYNNQLADVNQNITGFLLNNGKVELTLASVRKADGKSTWRKFEFTKSNQGQ